MKEVSDCCQRQFCGSRRTFSIAMVPSSPIVGTSRCERWVARDGWRVCSCPPRRCFIGTYVPGLESRATMFAHPDAVVYDRPFTLQCYCCCSKCMPLRMQCDWEVPTPPQIHLPPQGLRCSSSTTALGASRPSRTPSDAARTTSTCTRPRRATAAMRPCHKQSLRRTAPSGTPYLAHAASPGSSSSFRRAAAVVPALASSSR